MKQFRFMVLNREAARERKKATLIECASFLSHVV